MRKLLAQVDKRAVGKVDLLGGKGSDRQKLSKVGQQDKEPEEVTLKATNKAIERALGLALFFQGQEDCRVRLKTGSVGVVDDIVVDEHRGGEGKAGKNLEGGRKGGDEDAVMDEVQTGISDEPRKEDEEELPETQIRQVSVIEVAISLR